MAFNPPQRPPPLNGAAPVRSETSSIYSLDPLKVSDARESLGKLSRRRRRQALGLAAQATILAAMEPGSGATTRDALTAAESAARIAGLVKEASNQRVSLVVTFKGLRRESIDADAIEARIVEAAGLPPLTGGGGATGGVGGAGEGG